MTDLQLPAHLQGNRRSLATDAVRGMGVPPAPYIQIKGNKFTLVDAAGTEYPVPLFGPIFTDAQGNAAPGSAVGPYLDAVLMDLNEVMSKSYYEQDFDPSQEYYTPPICWSDNGVAPSISASQPQSATCELCEWNKWGSKVNRLNHPVKACDDIKKMAWYVPQLGMKTLFLLRLKGSSHKNFRTYVDKIVRQRVGDRTLDPTDLVTRIYFEPDQIGIMNFTYVSFVDPATAQLQQEVWATNGADRLVGRGDVPIKQLPAPQQEQQGQRQPEAPPPQTGWAPQPQPDRQAPPVPPQTAQPSPPAAPQTGGPRRGRRAAAPAPQGTPGPQPSPAWQGQPPAQPVDPMAIPGFLDRRNQNPPPPPPPAGAGAGSPPTSGAKFGQQHAPAPNATVDEALVKAFGLPLNP